MTAARDHRGIALIVASALFMQNLDSAVLATALPSMARDLGEDPARLLAHDAVNFLPEQANDERRFVRIQAGEKVAPLAVLAKLAGAGAKARARATRCC